MKTLHIYLTRQVLASLLLTVLVFTFVLLLGNVLKEILPMLISGQVSLGLVLHAIGLLIPFALVYALPMGLLTATLLVFGRFSADQELTAARASGISLLALIAPILLLSLALCGVCAFVNLQFGPKSRVAYNELRATMRSRLVGSILPEGRFVKDIPGFIIYVRKNDGHNLKDVMVYWLENSTNSPTAIISAPRGTFDFNPTNGLLDLHLFDMRSTVFADGDWHPGIQGDWTYQTNLNLSAVNPSGVRINDMTLGQLRAELRSQEQRFRRPAQAGKPVPEELRRQMNLLRQEKDWTLPIRVQMNWRISFSFACFGFTLVGIPLGLRMHRRETNVGIAVALGLVLVYYSFIFLGQSLATRPEWMPQFIVWLPNFIFQAVGTVLLWRANRGL